MICTQCKKNNPEHALYCMHCGDPLSSMKNNVIPESFYISKKEYDQLKNFETNYQQLVDAMNEKYLLIEFIFDETGKPVDFTYIAVNENYNESIALLFNVENNNLVGKTHTEVFKDSIPPFIDKYYEVAITKIPYEFDYYYKDYLLHLKHSIFYYDENQVVIVVDNITDIKIIENDLLEKNKELQSNKDELAKLNTLLLASLDQVPAGILIADTLNGSMLFANSAMAELVDQPQEVLTNLSLQNPNLEYTYFYPDNTPYNVLDLPLPQAALKQQVIKNKELIVRTAKDVKKWILANASPIYDSDNNLIAAITVMLDITDLKKVEQNLLETQLKFKAISDMAFDAIIMTDEHNTILYWNHAAEIITGYKKEEVLGKNSHQLLIPDRFKDKLAEDYKNSYETYKGQKNELFLLKKDGTEFLSEFSLSSFVVQKNTYVVSIHRDITKKKELQEQLVSERSNLEKTVKERTKALQESLINIKQANLHKTQFLSNISHELRTPLNAIIGFTQTLKMQYFGTINEKQEEYLSLVANSGEHLLALINDLLDMTKIDAGSMELTLKEFNTTEFINEIIALMSQQFRDKNISLDFKNIQETYMIKADKRMFKQIVLNLLSNALKFTYNGGKVSIDIEKLDKETKIMVSDTGMGINRQELNKIFSEFYQLDQVRDQSLGGTGIGLALTKRLVKLHNGKIGVESELDKGSTFWFTIPD